MEETASWMQRCAALGKGGADVGYNLRCIAKHPLFKDCSPRFLQLLAGEMDIRIYCPGEVIVKEGEVGESALVLHHGTVDVLVGPQQTKIAQLGEGVLLGEMILLGVSQRRNATVIAVEYCDCRIITTEQFQTVRRMFPKELRFFRRLAAAHVRALAAERRKRFKESSRTTASAGITLRSPTLSPTSLYEGAQLTQLIPELVEMASAETLSLGGAERQSSEDEARDSPPSPSSPYEVTCRPYHHGKLFDAIGFSSDRPERSTRGVGGVVAEMRMRAAWQPKATAPQPSFRALEPQAPTRIPETAMLRRYPRLGRTLLPARPSSAPPERHGSKRFRPRPCFSATAPACPLGQNHPS